jgi:anhydro-N-acetylmuramic acid kinase
MKGKMNKNINTLFEISRKKSRRIVGLMSGTSLDGLDIALCEIQGCGTETKVELLEFDTVTYEELEKNNIRQVFARPQVDFPYLTLLNSWLGTLHGQMVLRFLEEKNIPAHSVDCVASHGQTVMHVPSHQHNFSDFAHGTLQIGDGDHVARTTGMITISDFRQKHIAAGGEGAPLSVYGDYLLFSRKGEDRIMLNIGGISNFTFLPGSGQPGDVFVSDTGPGNTLMDQFMQKYFNMPYDKNANTALRGKTDDILLHQLMDHDFFQKPFPKTTGPEVFQLEWVESLWQSSSGLPDKYQVMATLNYFTAVTIARGIQEILGDRPCHIYISGGGAHNPLLEQHLSSLLPKGSFYHTSVLGIPGDAKEAVLFALLANETLSGSTIDFGCQNSIPSVSMGKICFPE